MRSHALSQDVSAHNLTPPSHNSVSARWLHVVLMVVAIASWMTFILACVGGPAWSPDGSQVLFPYRDVAHSQTSVALYDRATGRVKTIFAQPTKEKDDDLGVEVEWQKDGTRALVTLYQHLSSSSGYCELLLIPVRSSAPLQAYGVGSTDGCTGPHAQFGSRIYFGGQNLRWIDLDSGIVDSTSLGDEGVLVHPHGQELVYIRLNDRPSRSDKDVNETVWEFGHMTPDNLTPKPDFTLWEADRKKIGLSSDGEPAAFWDERTSRMAMVSSSADSDQIAIFDGATGYQRTLTPNIDANLTLGNLIWTDKMLYAAAFVTTKQEDRKEFSLAEIPLDGSRGRLTRIAAVHSKNESDFKAMLNFSMHVSLSPDGNFVAASPAVLDKDDIDARDRALFLIDLRDPKRHLQRIPIPVSDTTSRQSK